MNPGGGQAWNNTKRYKRPRQYFERKKQAVDSEFGSQTTSTLAQNY